MLLVQLGRSEHQAVIEPEAFSFLKMLGLSPNWNCTKARYVTAKADCKNVLVARILLDAKAGQEVRYRDGNPLNLTRANLELKASRKSIRRDRDLIDNQ